jgi:hypothetical protein
MFGDVVFNNCLSICWYHCPSFLRRTMHVVLVSSHRVGSGSVVSVTCVLVSAGSAGVFAMTVGPTVLIIRVRASGCVRETRVVVAAIGVLVGVESCFGGCEFDPQVSDGRGLRVVAYS